MPGRVFDEDVEVDFRKDDACIQTGDQRRWSNLKSESSRLVHRPGTVLGSAVLVAGTTIGAGILALPAVTHVRASSPRLEARARLEDTAQFAHGS